MIFDIRNVLKRVLQVLVVGCFMLPAHAWALPDAKCISLVRTPLPDDLVSIFRSLKKMPAEEALPKLDDLLAAHPAYDQLWAKKVQLLLEVGRPDEALATLDSLGATVENDPRFLDQRGRALLALGRSRDALAVAQRLAQLTPLQATQVGWKVEALCNEGRSLEALSAIEEYASTQPDDGVVISKKVGSVLERLTDREKRDNQPLLARLLQTLAQRRLFAQAGQVAAEITKFEPKNEAAREILILNLFREKRMADVISAAEAAAREFPHNWPIQELRIRALMDNYHYGEAEQVVDAALAIQPERFDALFLKAFCMVVSNRPEEAFTIIKRLERTGAARHKVAKLDQRAQNETARKALRALSANKVDQAIKSLNVLVAHANSGIAFYVRAQARMQSGNLAAALTDLENAERAGADRKVTRLLRSDLLAAERQFPEARKVMETLVDGSDWDSLLQWRIAKVHYLEGKAGIAVEHIRRAMQRSATPNPDLTTVYLAMAPESELARTGGVLQSYFAEELWAPIKQRGDELRSILATFTRNRHSAELQRFESGFSALKQNVFWQGLYDEPVDKNAVRILISIEGDPSAPAAR